MAWQPGDKKSTTAVKIHERNNYIDTSKKHYQAFLTPGLQMLQGMKKPSLEPKWIQTLEEEGLEVLKLNQDQCCQVYLFDLIFQIWVLATLFEFLKV